MGPAAAMTLLATQAVSRDVGLLDWLLAGDSWTGANGILAATGSSVRLSAAVVLTATLLAVPLGALLAHIRRGELAATWVVNVGRAIPTFAVAGLLVPLSLRWGLGFEPWPVFVALTLLAVPPIFLTTFTAVLQVDPVVVDAARGMGFDERAVLLKVESALALSVILTGIRVAAVQVVATEPIRAFLGGGGLGGYLRDGLGQNNDTLVLGGAILVAALAAVTGAAFGVLERIVVPKGVRRLRRGGDRRPGSMQLGSLQPGEDHEKPTVQAADPVGRLEHAGGGLR
jgi:osmoprotectant transport system permease protein